MDREIEEHLKARDVRYTQGRRAVVGALATAEGPLSAAELTEEAGLQVPLSSVYRTLVVLEEADVLVPHFGLKGVTRYELAEWITGHHHHLVCIECGAVDDIALDTRTEKSLHKLVDGIGESAGFKPVDHVLEIEGKCSRCQ